MDKVPVTELIALAMVSAQLERTTWHVDIVPYLERVQAAFGLDAREYAILERLARATRVSR